MIASWSPIGAKPSSTVVTMCTPTIASASSETFRCSASTTNRGQRPRRQRLKSTMPEHHARRQQHQRATAPAPRVRYQNARRTGARTFMPASSRPAADRRAVGRRRRPAAPGARARRAKPARRRPARSRRCWRCSRPRRSAAATLTVRQTAGAPAGRCAGSMMWWRVPPAASGARSCSTSRGRLSGASIVCPGAGAGVAHGRRTPGPASRRPGAGPATAMSPPRLTRTPAAERRRAMPPSRRGRRPAPSRSRRGPARRRPGLERAARRSTAHAPPSRGAGGAAGAGRRRRRPSKSRS